MALGMECYVDTARKETKGRLSWNGKNRI